MLRLGEIETLMFDLNVTKTTEKPAIRSQRHTANFNYARRVLRAYFRNIFSMVLMTKCNACLVSINFMRLCVRVGFFARLFVNASANLNKLRR